MSRIRRSSLFFTVAVAAAAAHAQEPEEPQDFSALIDQQKAELRAAIDAGEIDAEALSPEAKRLFDEIAARASRRADGRQVEVTSAAAHTSSLIDQSSVSDLIGLALNLSGLSGELANRPDDETDANAAQATVSAYALLPLFRGGDPLDPTVYCSRSSRHARRFSATAAYENDDDASAEIGSQRATIVGAKWLFWNGREACDPDPELFADAVEALKRAAIRDSEAIDRILPWLEEEFGEDFVMRLIEGPPEEALRSLDAEQRQTAMKIIRQGLVESAIYDADAHRASRALYEELLDRNQASIAATTRQTNGSADQYDAKLLFNRGLGTDWELIGNVGVVYREVEHEDDQLGGAFAASLRYRLHLFADRDATVSVTAAGNWKKNTGPIYEGQAKLAIPIQPGIELPIAITFANRTELVDESETRADIGVAIDTSMLLQLARDFARQRAVETGAAP